ncbi:hypothetical protein BH11PSE2_BH11PSE2_03300 [soil metagenome]
MISARTASRISVAGALVVLGLTVFSFAVPPSAACGDLAKGYPPIVAFEMARSVSDLQAIFGSAPGECRMAMSANMDSVNTLDCLIYIPAYGAFIAFFLVGLIGRAPRLARAGAWIVAVSCLADYVENAGLFNLSAVPDVASGWLTLMTVATEIKWIGLGIAGLIGGLILARGHGLWWIVLPPCALGLVVALGTLADAGLAGPYLSLAFAAGWLVFLVVGVREAVRRTP